MPLQNPTPNLLNLKRSEAQPYLARGRQQWPWPVMIPSALVYCVGELCVRHNMADTRPTPVTTFEAIKLCCLLIFAPSKFQAQWEQDLRDRNNYTERSATVNPVHAVRSAFWTSLVLVLVFSALGFIAGKLMGVAGRCATPNTISTAQVIGAGVLLWGTLFVRGWEVQSYSGVQFPERVNQWIYRGLYCIGTAIMIYSLSFKPCPT